MSKMEQLSLDLERTDYRIRESRRAKYMRLSVSPLGVVEVVKPLSVSWQSVSEFVAKHEDWIKRTLARVRSAGGDGGSRERALPHNVYFHAFDQRWQVSYLPNLKHKLREAWGEDGDKTLLVKHAAAADVQSTLCQWLSVKAKQLLIPWFEQVSVETGLSYKKVSVRAQKTRWGSCSSAKHISLNRALVFLPKELVRYLFIHELCHTRFLNHSAQYWEHVSLWLPNYKNLDAALNKATGAIPLWAYHRT